MSNTKSCPKSEGSRRNEILRENGCPKKDSADLRSNTGGSEHENKKTKKKKKKKKEYETGEKTGNLHDRQKVFKNGVGSTKGERSHVEPHCKEQGL